MLEIVVQTENGERHVRVSAEELERVAEQTTGTTRYARWCTMHASTHNLRPE
ncbi:hypothetical protein GTW66_19315 [Streptomyces sp. SID5473]|nr:hypothetical protein [Streptomyces sp. SID5473]